MPLTGKHHYAWNPCKDGIEREELVPVDRLCPDVGGDLPWAMRVIVHELTLGRATPPTRDRTRQDCSGNSTEQVSQQSHATLQWLFLLHHVLLPFVPFLGQRHGRNTLRGTRDAPKLMTSDRVNEPAQTNPSSTEHERFGPPKARQRLK